jgi:hypothetical protein
MNFTHCEDSDDDDDDDDDELTELSVGCRGDAYVVMPR